MKQKLLFLLSTGLLVAMVLVSCSRKEEKVDERLIENAIIRNINLADSISIRIKEDSVYIEFNEWPEKSDSMYTNCQLTYFDSYKNKVHLDNGRRSIPIKNKTACIVFPGLFRMAGLDEFHMEFRPQNYTFFQETDSFYYGGYYSLITIRDTGKAFPIVYGAISDTKLIAFYKPALRGKMNKATRVKMYRKFFEMLDGKKYPCRCEHCVQRRDEEHGFNEQNIPDND